ncbi:hypothetical protein KIH77_02340 [Bifidobacterium sp. 82T24]|uniref:condensation domain-containing protein n=1 Tax=Bifidobacterium pluvialisilvae TaxID=2834436 RepID=UPI001C598E9C|nr:condensation domain-containing protein [Bifidobacterium pluvialisilvae]MBW3087580.1 hypothetical protein [Bifidobacterium pluvialisilvae]
MAEKFSIDDVARKVGDKVCYPLTQSQKLMFYNLKFSFRKQIVNICSLVDLYERLDEGRLMQAVYLAMMRIPSNSVRVHIVDKQPMQYFATDVPHDIELVDMSDRTQKQVEAACNEIGSKPFPNGGNDVQLYRVRIIRRAHGLHSLYFCVSHVVFDAYSLMTCLTYIFAVYRALEQGTPLPEEPHSPLPAYEDDFAMRRSDRYRRQQQWWKDHYTTEPQFTSINGRGGKGVHQGQALRRHPAPVADQGRHDRLPDRHRHGAGHATVLRVAAHADADTVLHGAAHLSGHGERHRRRDVHERRGTPRHPQPEARRRHHGQRRPPAHRHPHGDDP